MIYYYSKQELTMNKKLLNARIEALTDAHGKQIVDFYKSQGFDTSGYVMPTKL